MGKEDRQRMARRTAYLENLGACDFCNNCVEEGQPWYFFGMRRPSFYCARGNDNFARISSAEQCEDFIDLEDDYYDGPEEPRERPSGANSVWGGSRHEGDHEDWSWNHDEEDDHYYDPEDDHDE